MKAILTFQGFTESQSRRTGTEDLYWNVIKRFACHDVTTDWPRQWTSDVDSLVKLLARQGIKQVAIVSYSHGQAAATAFSRESYEAGINVDLWLACDPVYRPTWLPRSNFFQPFAFRALLKTGKIKVPRNIRRVSWCKQAIDLPRGHDLIPDSPLTLVTDPQVLPYSHTAIDHAPEWFALVKRELAAWIRESETEKP